MLGCWGHRQLLPELFLYVGGKAFGSPTVFLGGSEVFLQAATGE